MEINVLETIERDLIEKYSEKGDIILMGDFNAKDLSNLSHWYSVSIFKKFYTCVTIFGNNQKRNTHFVTI
jgi:hypothetical protein